MKRIALLAVVVLSVTACIKEKQNVVAPLSANPTAPDTTNPQPHQHAHFADSLDKNWNLGRSYYFRYKTTDWDTATSQFIYATIDTNYSDSIMPIAKIDDTTINFIGYNYTLKNVDSIKKIALYYYKAHQYAPDYTFLEYYYNTDSVYIEYKNWTSTSSGFRTYRYYSK